MPELIVDDFCFNGRLGSQGARIARVGRNHFHIQLGQAPGHPEWCNLLQFEILRHAKGNDLRLDVAFDGDPKLRFNHDASTWSYDGRNWMPANWKFWNKPGGEKEDTLTFPAFTEDQIFFGAQVPMPYEDVVEFMERYGCHPDVRVHVIGQSPGGRNIYRLEITERGELTTDDTDPQAAKPHPQALSRALSGALSTKLATKLATKSAFSRRWAFHVNQQHSGEHHAKWRMIGMIDWLLSDAGADFRRRSVWHFVLEMNPDAPSNGWYRVSSQGVDLNRAYLMSGPDPDRQPQESYVMQKDFVALMASETPITACWSMHTWPDEAQPFMHPGPEVGTRIGPWTDLRDLLERLDVNHLINPLIADDKKQGTTNAWHRGPFEQYGITNYVCEGSDFWTDKKPSLEVGRIFMQAMAEYYAGCME